MSLVDPYEAYEIYEKQFEMISGDLELIQTEGIQTVKQVDPNMIIKKKKDKDEEVQDGWKGHIVPFELAQDLYFSKEKAEYKEMQDKLAEIPSAYEELLELLSEDEKESISEALEENNETFIFKNIKGMLLINGMPVFHIELKRSGVPVQEAVNQIEKYSHEGVFTGLFSLVQVFVAMNPEEMVFRIWISFLKIQQQKLNLPSCSENFLHLCRLQGFRDLAGIKLNIHSKQIRRMIVMKIS